MVTLQSLQAILEQQKESKLTNFQIGFLIYFLLMGPGMLLLALCLLSFSDTPSTLFWIWGILHSGILTWLVLDVRNDKFCAALLLDAIKIDGKELVWVYTEKVYRDEYTLERIEIHFLFRNKKHGTIPSRQAEFEQYQQLFANTFPTICIGYSEEIEKAFKKDPAALKNNPLRSGIIKKSISHSDIFNGW